MTVYHTGLETACYAAEKEREGMPPSFKEHGYAQPKVSRANLVLVRSHLQDAMQAGASGEVLTAIVAAIKEIERH
jgi:hypothetical protein